MRDVVAPLVVSNFGMVPAHDTMQHLEKIKRGWGSRTVCLSTSCCCQHNLVHIYFLTVMLMVLLGDFQFIDEGREIKSFYAADDQDVVDSKPVHQLPSSDTKPRPQPPPPPAPPPPSFPTSYPAPPPEILHSPASAHKSPSSILSAPEFPFVSPTLTAATTNLVSSPSKRRRTNEGSSPSYSLHREPSSSLTYDPVRSFVVYESPKTSSPYVDNGFMYAAQITSAPKVVEAEYRRLADSEAAMVPADELLSPTIWKEQFIWPNSWTTNQCSCLMRYFIEHLAAWVSMLYQSGSLLANHSAV